MASGGGFSYRPNVNRNVTKKWREASRPTYDDDDDWGDDGYGNYDEPPPMPAPATSRPGWGGQMPPPSRSFTNPSPPRSTGRASFDRGDDRRYVSTGNSFESPYPTSQRAPFPEPQHDEPPRFYAQPPPLQVNTHGQGPYPPPNVRPGSRGSQRPPYVDAPFSAPGPYGQQRSQSGNRPSPGGYSQRQGSPARPDSRGSNHSNRFQPPRKSSLVQEQVPPPPAWTGGTFAQPREGPVETVAEPSEPVKPLPFIRPSDIYKRMEEEKERERKSMDSSRPNLELDTTRSHDSAATPRIAVADGKQNAPIDRDTESARRLRTNLDTVPERKSEYGLDNSLKTSQQNEGVQRHGTNASSVYTDRPDPVSASTDDNEDAEPSSAFSFEPTLPAFNRMSAFDPQLGNVPSAHDPMPNNRAETSTAGIPEEGATLDHKASVGYRSVVNKAFDGPNSPVSTNDTIPRSNSASTSELSPIITRKPDIDLAGPSIPEEPQSVSSDRPLSGSTIKGVALGSGASALPIATVVQPGFRRETTPPNSGSPARQADLRHSSEIEPQSGVLTRASTSDVDTEVTERGRDATPVIGGVTSPSASQASVVSEEFKKWQAHSQQFNNTLERGIISPKPESPISRAESPPKGTVKELADKYGGNSGRSTPVSIFAGDSPLSRPSQARLESFRPVLPGGWQSYTVTPSVGTPQQELSNPSVRPEERRYDSSESVPTATAPRDLQHGTSKDAFAAAAAAGTALAGSFSGPAFSGRHAEASEDESENEWDHSSTSSKEHPQGHEVRDFAASNPPSAAALPSQKSKASVPPDTVTTHDAQAGSPQDTNDMSYFPAPLRMSKSLEPGTNTRPPGQTRASIDEDLEHGNNEELQKEIVKSLTPRSSNIETQDEETAVSTPVPVNASQLGGSSMVTGLHESDDMYGGRSAQHTPSIGPPAGDPEAPTHQPQFSVSSAGSEHQRPFLEQRFSWEMDKLAASDSGGAKVAPIVSKPSTVKAMDAGDMPREETGPTTVGETSADVALHSPRSPSSSHDGKPSPVESAFAVAGAEGISKALPTATATGPTHVQSYQNIMRIGNQQERIKAFEDTRLVYGHSDGVLDQWIQSMQGPEFADVFQSNGRLSRDVNTGKDKAHPQRVPSSRPLGNITGGRVMQEDGKKLMAAAGRFSGKAGVAAKGLFAKGKDKLRAASASEKGDKRKPTGSMPTIDDQYPDSTRHSTGLLAAPQLPESDMVVSPMDESKWFGFSEEGGDKGRSTDDGQTDSKAVAEHLAAEDMNASAAQRDLHVLNSASATDSHPETSTAIVPAVQVEPAVASNTSKGITDGAVAAAAGANAVERLTSHHQRNVSDLTADEMAKSHALAARDQLQPSERLGASDERRNSGFSAVSSASPSPAVSHDAAERSISPAVQEHPPMDTAPGYEETALPTDTKEAEAAHDRAADVDTNDPVPRYEETPGGENRHPHIPPGAQIVPVANLGAQRRTDATVSSRPFSFEGSEALRQAQEAYVLSQQQTPEASQPLSPVSQMTSKPISQISAEDVAEERNSQQNRQSKSYSRPFGVANVNISQHPAFREEDQPLDRSQMYSYEAPPEAPLADPQRLKDEAARYRDQLRPTEDQGYRIPGPYGQEYRSPKPKAQTPSPTAPQQRAQTLPTPVMPQMSDAYEDFGDKRFPAASSAGAQQQQQPMGPPPRPSMADQQARPTKRSFGAFFRGKSKQQQQHPAANMAMTRRESSDVDDFGMPSGSSGGGNKRPGFFSRNSRKDSFASANSSHGESRDVVGQLPTSGRTAKRFSRDMGVGVGAGAAVTAGIAAQHLQEQRRQQEVTNRKKKRFSAMGNLFSGKSDKAEMAPPPQRSSTLPSGTVQPNRNSQLEQGGYQDTQGGTYQQPQGVNSQQSQDHPLNQHSASLGPSQHPDARPSDLRIDTSNVPGGRRLNQPATAPPQTYAPRDISYTGGSQNNSYQGQPTSTVNTFNNTSLVTAPLSSQTTHQPPTTRAAPSSASGSSGINPHVMNLHKRSRSPASESRRRSQLAPPEPEDDGSASLPATGLGTFISKKYSPVDGVVRGDGEQEKPWRIGIPGVVGEDEEAKRRSRQVRIEQGGRSAGTGGGGGEDRAGLQQMTVGERMMAPSSSSAGSRAVANGQQTNGHAAAAAAPSGVVSPMATGFAGDAVQAPPPIPQMSPDRAAMGSRDGRKGGYVAELPGSKAEGYESEEEVTMSATVRPGDWDWNMPVFVDDTK